MDRIGNIFVCLFVSKKFLLQLRAVNPLLKTQEEQEADGFWQEMSHPAIEEPWSDPGRNDQPKEQQGGLSVVQGSPEGLPMLWL